MNKAIIFNFNKKKSSLITMRIKLHFTAEDVIDGNGIGNDKRNPDEGNQKQNL